MARQHGTGSIYQRSSDGRWMGKYRDGYTPAGNYRYATVSGTSERDVRAKLNKAIRAARDAETTISPRMTVKAWCDEWLPMQEKRVRPKAFTADKGAVNNWIVPTIGARKLVDLTPADVRKVQDAVSAKRKQATAIRVHATLMGALKAASQEGYNVPGRVLQAPPPRADATQSDRADVTVADAVKLLKAAEDMPDRSRWVAALLQGMRQGECTGLTWDHVDLDAGTLDVSWQLQPLPYAHGCDKPCGKAPSKCPAHRFRTPVGYEHEQVFGAWHLVRPKTSSGQRVMPLVPWMVTALRQWQEVAPDSRLVWPRPDGKPRTDKMDLAQWHALQERAGVRHPGGRYYHLHEARHAAATMLMALGVDTQVIIAIMGHASILSTRQYQHADLSLMRAALDGVAERLQLTS